MADFNFSMLDNFFGNSREEFEQGVPNDPPSDDPPTPTPTPTAPDTTPDPQVTLADALAKLEAKMDAKDAEEKARLNKVLDDILGKPEPKAEEPLDLAAIMARAESAEAMALELATKQTLAEIAAASEKHKVDRDALLKAVIDSKGADPDILAAKMVEAEAAAEKVWMAKLAAKNPAIAAALKGTTSPNVEAPRRGGQDAPTLRGAPTGVPHPNPNDLKRRSGESSSEHLERLLAAGAHVGF